MGLRRKTLLGIAEERGGRRGAGNAIANTGVAADRRRCSRRSSYATEAALIAFVAALTAGGERYRRQRDRQGVGHGGRGR